MLERFKGQEGRRRLVEVLANQELVLQDCVLAQQFAEVAKLETYKKGQKIHIEGQLGKNKLSKQEQIDWSREMKRILNFKCCIRKEF